VVVDTPEGREDEVMDIMENYDVVDIDERAEHWRTEGWTGYEIESRPYTTDQVKAERDQYLKTRTGASGVRNYPVTEFYRTDVTGYETADYDVYASDFHNHYNQYSPANGHTYPDYEPAYRYGYDLAMDRRYANYEWADLEAEARRRWEAEHFGTWEKFKDSIRYGWERVKASVT
jgi:hypothetical protein